ncbi:MAG TPA: response regulator transcription factor [Candidatus Paceibacterota bacterium]|nr:response regulator transcription factor [Candidatus Paceibacterota bacterium]
MKTDKPIRIMVVDDHPALRKGLIALIASEPGMSVVFETGDGREAVRQFALVRPDVVLMDLRLPGFSGVEAIMEIRRNSPDARFIVVTTYETDEDVYRAIRAGAQAYLLKDSDGGEILKTIRAVYGGGIHLSEKMTKRLSDRMMRENLNSREIAVLEMLIKGRSNKEIAESLSLPETTVKFCLRELFVKLGVQDRTEAVVSALRQGIVQLEE